MIVCDIGHNEDGITEVLLNISRMPHKKLHVVFGMVNDKDITGVLQLLPKDAAYYFCQAKIPRAMDALELSRRAISAGLNGVVVTDVNEAIAAAKQKAALDDLIYIGGSTFVVAEIEGL